MTESCKTCLHRLNLKRYDYSNGGCTCTHEDITNGFVCTCFADEGVAIWQVGTDVNIGFCECYEPKRKEVVRRAEQ